MTLPGQVIRVFFPRSIFHTKTCLRTYFGTKYSICPLNTCTERKSDLRNFCRSFSLESFTTYPTIIFNHIAESNVCEFTKNFFIYMHDLTSLPWWCTIAASAAIMKIYSLPWTMYQLKLNSQLRAINNKMPEISERVYAEMRVKQQELLWTPEEAKKMYENNMKCQRRQLIEKHNCHFLKILLLGYVEFPVWIIFSMTWRTMCYGCSDDISSSKDLISQFITEGPFWCVNLTEPDPTCMLSLLIILSQFAVIELSDIQIKLLEKESGTLQKIFKYIVRCFGIIAGVVSSFMPSSVAAFWFFSIALTLLRDLLFLSPKVRRVLRLPEQKFSYEEVFEALKNKYMKKFKL